MTAIHAAARQIHESTGAVEGMPPIAEILAVPVQLLNRGGVALRAAAEDDYLIPLAHQNFGERLAEKSAPAGENNAWLHVRGSGTKQAPLSQDRRVAISR